MQVTGQILDERFQVLIDHNAEPADWDAVLAEFLLEVMRPEPDCVESIGQILDERHFPQLVQGNSLDSGTAAAAASCKTTPQIERQKA